MLYKVLKNDISEAPQEQPPPTPQRDDNNNTVEKVTVTSYES